MNLGRKRTSVHQYETEVQPTRGVSDLRTLFDITPVIQFLCYQNKNAHFISKVSIIRKCRFA